MLGLRGHMWSTQDDKTYIGMSWGDTAGTHLLSSIYYLISHHSSLVLSVKPYKSQHLKS